MPQKNTTKTGFVLQVGGGGWRGSKGEGVMVELGQRGWCDSQKRCEECKHMSMLAFGKNCKFNTTVIEARKNKSLFFSKPKLVQKFGLCGNSQLPAAQSRKPHDKANLKCEESVCLFKLSQGEKSFLFLSFPTGQLLLSWGGASRWTRLLSWENP